MTLERAWINLTTSCNNNCLWCYASSEVNKNIDLSDYEFARIINLLKNNNCKIVNLVGGEPTVHPKIADMVRILYDEGFIINISSNGRKFSNEEFVNIFQPFKERINITFSIEGTKFVHNQITRVQSFDQALEGIKRCLEAGLNLSVNTTLCKRNYENLSDLYKQLYLIGVNNFSMNFAVPPLNSSFLEEDYLPLSKVNLKLEQIVNLVKDWSVDFVFTTPLPLCVLSPSLLLSIENKELIINTACSVINGTGITFSSNGDIVPCTHLVSIELINIKNIEDDSKFQKFWNNELDNSLRKNIRKYPSEICTDCDMKERCFGGCPLLWVNNFYYDEIF